MTYHQEHTNHFTTDNDFCQTEKQRIGFILDDKKEEGDMYHSKRLPALEQSYQKRLSNMQFIPYDPSKQSLQRLPSPFHEEENRSLPQQQERMPPTANELEYIKRIQALMTLVARQTKEIQSLREIIKAHNNNNNNNNNNTDMPMNRKRNKQS